MPTLPGAQSKTPPPARHTGNDGLAGPKEGLTPPLGVIGHPKPTLETGLEQPRISDYEEDTDGSGSELEVDLLADDAPGAEGGRSSRQDLVNRLRNLALRAKPLEGVARQHGRPGNARKVRANSKVKAKGK